MFGTDAGVLRINHLRLARNKTPQEIHFLVINVIQILRTKKALGHEFSCERLVMSD